ncbi:MAG: amino acid ABC transporter substrate-binding protein [Tenericutes bacterium HGW-Tenericutes-3]|jgi:polar amino acid transport system substrate-binding protein|nr:MAG: amino acid ABC transporter substrate-binding protein [Tenericutes bacterium HGW-Tenericutes-3]
MKKLLVLSIMVLSLFTVIGCNQGVINSWERLEDRGYMIVGLDDTFAPMGFRDNSGNLVGFDVDLAKEVGERLGVEVRFQPIDWDSKVLELNSGTIDMIWNGLTITESRLEEMLFSIPYIANTQMIMVASDSSINLISDLTGKKLGVQISSAAEESVNANAIVSSLGELIKYDQYNQALLELKNGTIDAVVIDEIMGRYIISQSEGDYKVASENFAEETYGVGFRLESDSIRDKINEILNDMIEDGTASEISIKWFDEDIFLG